MGCLICPNCKNEYTIIPELFKPGSFKCTKCGWSTDTNSNEYDWKIWFEDDYFEKCKDDLYNWLLKYAFIGEGFPIELLKNRVAYRDNILLFEGYRKDSSIVVEFALGHHFGKGPAWLKTDSTGRPLSFKNYYNAWISRNNLDTVFAVDNPKTGFRIMEAFWRTEGRVPDVVWVSPAVPTRIVDREDLYVGKKVIALGRKGLKESLTHRAVYVSAYLDTTNCLLPQDLYYACRKMEDIANDPRNYNLTIELQMAVSKPCSGRAGLCCAPEDYELEDQVSYLCRASKNPGRVPKTIPVGKKRKSKPKRKSSKQCSKSNETENKTKTKTCVRHRNHHHRIKHVIQCRTSKTSNGSI